MYSVCISIKKMRLYAHFKTYKKAISLLLIISFITVPLTFLTFPQKASATCSPFVTAPVPDLLSVPINLSKTDSWNLSDAYEKGTTFFKTCILDGLATMIAKQIIKQLTNSIVRWINSGFKGNPSFVQNTGKFFGGIADKVAGNVIENIAPFLCSPFRLNIQLALAMSQTSQDNITCTLTDVENNFKNFTNGTGSGWNNWFNITQNPQNNPDGAMMIAQAQLNASIETAQSKYEQQLNWGKGFLSFEDCPTQVSGTAGEVSSPASMPANQGIAASYSSYHTNSSQNSLGNNSLASIGSLDLLDSVFGQPANSKALAAVNTTGGTTLTGTVSGPGYTPQQTLGADATLTTVPATNSNTKQVYDADNQPVYGVQAGDNGCVTKTPGAVIESQLENTLGSDLRGLEIAQSIDQIVAALVGQLVSQALGGIGGLAGAGSSSSSGSSGGNSFNYQNSVNSLGGTTNGSASASIPNLPITGACTPNKQTAAIGEPVTWNAYVPDINGSATYTWYGDENLSGNSASVTTNYTTNGTKAASVIVTTSGANAQTAQIDCLPDVTIGATTSTGASAPTISCTASPNTASLSSPTPVTWQAVVIGGTAPFIYSWQGSDGLSGTGQSLVKTYATAGAKSATVSVTSADGNTYSNTCATVVSVTP